MTEPLVTADDYTRTTGETIDATTLLPAFTEAIALIEETIGRKLIRGTYVERCKVYDNNLAYPVATPLVSISDPLIDASSIQGAGVWVGTRDPGPLAVDDGALPGGLPSQITLTYVGGYTAETLPAKLRRAICRTAYNIRHPATLQGVPGNVSAVQVGDVAYSSRGPLRTFDPLDAGIRSDIRRFRNPKFGGFSTIVSGPV